VGQCGDGELLLVAQDRKDSAKNISIKERSEGRCVRLHRTLLQSETSTFDDRLYEPYGVRETGWISLGGCQPNRVQASSYQTIRERNPTEPPVCTGGGVGGVVRTGREFPKKIK
jgi:hypothetical protein